ncbi:MAG: hypothetical protein AAF916_03940 [Planctomycetota bacterium]
MTKEQLADQLSKSITPVIEKFAAQPSPAAAELGNQRTSLEKQRADAAKVLDTGSAAYSAAVAAIDEELKGLKIDDRTQRKQNLQLAAEALVIVANTLRVPVKLKDTGRAAAKSSSGAGSGGNKRSRKSNAQMEQEAAAVLKALPSAKKDFVAKADIADKVGFDPQSALLKLKRDELAESNGVRGAGGGWRKA